MPLNTPPTGQPEIELINGVTPGITSQFRDRIIQTMNSTNDDKINNLIAVGLIGNVHKTQSSFYISGPCQQNLKKIYLFSKIRKLLMEEIVSIENNSQKSNYKTAWWRLLVQLITLDNLDDFIKRKKSTFVSNKKEEENRLKDIFIQAQEEASHIDMGKCILKINNSH